MSKANDEAISVFFDEFRVKSLSSTTQEIASALTLFASRNDTQALQYHSDTALALKPIITAKFQFFENS